MTLPLAPPLLPQLARSAQGGPRGGRLVGRERKLDGFRAIAFVDDDAVEIQSRSGKPLARYFPEIALPRGATWPTGRSLAAATAAAGTSGLLQQRLPSRGLAGRAARRADPGPLRRLRPAGAGDESLLDLPFAERRAALEATPGLEPVETSTDPARAAEWLHLEGVILKRLDAPYRPGKRQGMVKIKRVRTIDCVVIGWRPGTVPDTVGSLILGLYDVPAGCGPWATAPASPGRASASCGPSWRPTRPATGASADPGRWSAGRELEWVGLR